MADRDHFLAGVAAALRRGAAERDERAPAGALLSPAPPASSPDPADRAAVLRLFAERLREAGGVAVTVADRDAAFAAIGRLVHERDGARVACPAALRRREIDDLWVDDFRCADVGLSAAEWGIAETGTVVMRHRGEHGRGYSLVPPAVGFVLPASRVVLRLGAVLAALEDDGAGHEACVTFVSGASHSADIAGIPCFGVHGPAEVHVWVVADE